MSSPIQEYALDHAHLNFKFVSPGFWGLDTLILSLSSSILANPSPLLFIHISFLPIHYPHRSHYNPQTTFHPTYLPLILQSQISQYFYWVCEATCSTQGIQKNQWWVLPTRQTQLESWFLLEVTLSVAVDMTLPWPVQQLRAYVVTGMFPGRALSPPR